MIKNYTFTLNLSSLFLSIFLLIPTVVWYYFPAANDVLRTESATPVFDIAASVSQVLFIGILCLMVNESAPKLNFRSIFMIATFLSCSLYYFSWIAYYIGMMNFIVILALILAPCAAFLFYALDRKNDLALFPIGIFSTCHLVYGVVNFL